jgi:hypothetical protein
VTGAELTPAGYTPAYVSGVNGQAIDFAQAAETTAHLTQPHYSELAIGNESFTLAFWVNAALTNNVDQYLFHKGSTTADVSAGTSGKWIGVEYKNGNLKFAIDDDVTKTEVAQASSPCFDGEWHHIVCIRNVRTKMLRLFVDGEEVSSGADETGDISQSEDLVLANSTVRFNCRYTGKMDELTWYRGANNAAGVKQWYQQTKPNALTSEPSVTLTRKVLEDGQVVIIRNGKRYSVLGVAK